MAQNRYFRSVVRYETADGQTFKTIKDAHDHVENVVGAQVQALLKEAQKVQKISLGAKDEFRLCQFLVANADKFTQALSSMVAFDASDDETGEEE